MWSLPSEDSAEALSNRLSSAWDRQVQMVKDGKKKKANLKFAIARAYGGPYLVAGILKAGYDSLSFLQPQILRLLLRYVNSYGTDHPLPPVAGFSIAILMFVVANIATAMLHQYFDRCFTTGEFEHDRADVAMRIKSGLITLIYRKSIRLSNGEKTGRTSGDIVNLQSVDAVRIADLSQYGHIAWSGPFQIILAFISLFNLVGWQALMGIGVMALSVSVIKAWLTSAPNQHDDWQNQQAVPAQTHEDQGSPVPPHD